MIRIIIRTVLPERKHYYDELNKEIGENVEWCFDDDKNAMNTFLKSMKMAGDDCCIHMEDDIILTTNFIERINSIINKNKNNVIQFYSMRKNDIILGTRFERGSTFSSNLCFYLPKEYSKMIYDFYEVWERKEEHPTGYDLMIADFLKKRKEKYLLYVPNLVDHKQGVSMINKRRSQFRKSTSFE